MSDGGRIFVIGAAHLDRRMTVVSADLEASEDRQHFVSAELSAGGTGLNLARACARAGRPAVFVPVIGNDLLGTAILGKLETSDFLEIRPVRAKVASTIVDLIFVKHNDKQNRLVFGPSLSPVDAVDEMALGEALEDAGASDLVIVDGYLLRLRRRGLETLFSRLVENGARIALEFAPHAIWQFRTLADLRRSLECCDRISASIATVERCFAVEPRPAMEFGERVERLQGMLRQFANTRWHLRGGWKDSEFVALVGADSVQMIRYGIHHGAPFALGDSQFVGELLSACSPDAS